MAPIPERSAHRGAVLHFRSDPGASDSADSYEYWPDGLLIVSGGYIDRVGPADQLLSTLSDDIAVHEHGDAILLPGFIDTHIHYPQSDVIGSAGTDLLDWLEHYTFPAERSFEYASHARVVAE